MKPWKAFQNRSTRRTNSNPTGTDEIVKQMFSQPAARRNPNEPAAAFTFGNVWARIWLNDAGNGSHYLRISLHRIDNKNGNECIRNNFRPDDLNDLIRAVRRCHIWLNSPSK